MNYYKFYSKEAKKCSKAFLTMIGAINPLMKYLEEFQPSRLKSQDRHTHTPLCQLL